MPLTIKDPNYFFSLLSAKMLEDPKPAYIFDQFANKEIDFDKTEGDTIQIDRFPYFGEAGLTQTARELSETTTVGTDDPVNVTSEAVTVLLKEYSGPYNSTLSKVAPLGVTEKVARRAQKKIVNNESPEDFFNSIGGGLLKDDHDRWHDRVLCNLMLTSGYTTNPDSKANGATVSTDKIDTEDLGTIKEKLSGDRKVSTFSDGLYWGVVSPRMEKHLRNDSKFREAMQFGDPKRLYRGELGVYEGFRFFTSNNMPTETVNGLTANLGIFFGPNSIGYGVGMPEEVRRNKNDDYERFLYLIWLTYKGYAALDTRFIEVARTFAP